ncbi:MAG: sigma-70 family RNA polymerase sigma factor [Paenisporosarcina sp.]
METFDEVLKAFEPMIYAILRRLRIYKDHEQFIQIGRIGLWQAWKRYQEERGNFAPFAYRSIYGMMLDELKKSNAYDLKTLPTEDDVLERFIGAASTSKTPPILDGLQEALHVLNDQEKKLIQLLFFEGYTLEEVAIQIGISKSGVKKKRERTLKKLRDFISMDCL